MGDEGGVWGEGFREQRQRQLPRPAQRKAAPYPQPSLTPAELPAVTSAPHIRGGGPRLGGSWGGLGVGTAQLPKPPPPPEPLPNLVVQVGTGALLGVAKISFFFYALYLPSPPRSLPEYSCRARSGHGLWGGTVGERAGKIKVCRASLNPPSPGAAPKKKALGEGG